MPTDTVLYRAELAQYLNVINGCTVFHAWNVLSIPEMDLYELHKCITWENKLRKTHGG